MKALYKNILLATAFAAAPLAVYAVVQDSQLHISGYGYVGGANQVSGTCGQNFSVGYNNVFSNSMYSAAVGYGITNHGSYGLAVGYYNKTSTTASPLFIVGSGSSSERRNALEVLTGGLVNVPLSQTGAKLTVGTTTTTGNVVTTKIYGTTDIDRVPPKGGISMGEFAVTPP